MFEDRPKLHSSSLQAFLVDFVVFLLPWPHYDPVNEVQGPSIVKRPLDSVQDPPKVQHLSSFLSKQVKKYSTILIATTHLKTVGGLGEKITPKWGEK